MRIVGRHGGPPGRAVFASVILFAALSGPAFAQRELRVKAPTETVLPFVTTVVAPLARHAVVNDAAGVLAVAHRLKAPMQLSLFRLDAQGQIVPGEPVNVVLPKPAALGDRVLQVLAMVSHPRLPLLYVWQDVEPLPDSKPTDPAHVAELDHLLIYSLEEPQPKLVYATARGDGFTPGCFAGGMELNATATRLYVPNRQQVDRAKKVVSVIGWFVLDPDGLPAYGPPNSPPEETTPPPAPPPVLDAAAAAAARTAKLAAIEQAKAAGQPLVLRQYAEATTTFGSPPAPFCYAPLNDDAIFLASHSGPASWVLSERLGRICYFYVVPYVAYRYRIAIHPTTPSVYITTTVFDGRVLRMEHADGQFTLAPQTLTIDPAVYYSTPILLPKTNQLVLGGNGILVLIDLDAEGKFTTKVARMTLYNPMIEALAWSPKFEKLYVPLEKMP